MPDMNSYVNSRPLVELFAGVENAPSVDSRIAAIRALQEEFVRLAVTSLERVAYDLAEKGWTARQIADEIGVSRTYIAKMAGAYAAREGRLSPFPTPRRYDHAVDISALVGAEARRRSSQPLPDPSDSASPTTA